MRFLYNYIVEKLPICLPIQVYLSHNLPEPVDSRMSKNVEQRPGIQSIQGNIFIFHDGSTAEVDNFIYCTGKMT